jgi:hypothetical protein
VLELTEGTPARERSLKIKSLSLIYTVHEFQLKFKRGTRLPSRGWGFNKVKLFF